MRPSSLALIGSIILLGGCNNDGLPDMVPIRGTVMLDGNPVSSGTVLYSPVDRNAGRQARGAIQPDGSFQLTTLRPGDGAQLGEYQIAIIAIKPLGTARAEVEQRAGKVRPESLVPLRYSNPSQSGLTDTVDGNHTGLKDLELSSS